MLNFFLAAIVIALAPGPDNLFVLAQSATYGSRLGLCIILGLCTGIVIQTGLLIAGVSAVIVASPVAFFVLQCAGACYLLYLAYKSFSVRTGTLDLNGKQKIDTVSGRKLYLRGVVMNMSNPKVILFLLSLIPPTVRLDRNIHPSLQIAIFGAEFVVATFIVFSMVALLAGTIKKFLLNSPKANRNLNYFSGVVFVILAITLFVL